MRCDSAGTVAHPSSRPAATSYSVR
jgi:hypothetical protein